MHGTRALGHKNARGASGARVQWCEGVRIARVQGHKGCEGAKAVRSARVQGCEGIRMP